MEASVDAEDLTENISLMALIQSSPMEKSVYQFTVTFSSGCLGATAVFALFVFYVLASSRARYPSIYRRYIHVFICFCLLDALVYKLTYVNLIVWHNSVVFFADGFFDGPRAVGVHMIFTSLPTALLCLLNLYKYAQVTKSSRLEFLSSPHCLPFVTFWLGISIAMNYGIMVMLFQTDADSVDQTADLFFWALDKGRDVGFEHCIGTYWAVYTFNAPKWKPIVGLGIFHLMLLIVFVYNFVLSGMITRAERSQRLYSAKSYKYIATEPRHLAMLWIQFAITLLCSVLPRLVLASLPLFYDCDGLTGSYWAQRLLTRWPMFTVPLRPILSILAVLIIVKDIRRHLKGCFRRRPQGSATAVSVVI